MGQCDKEIKKTTKAIMQLSLRDGFCDTNDSINVILTYLLFSLLFQQSKKDASSFERRFRF